MGVALSAASSFKNSLFHLSLSSVFTLCCSVFSFLGRPNIPHNTHSASRRKVLIIKRKKKKKKKQRKKLKKKKKKQRKSE
jgi:hypothetical protein